MTRQTYADDKVNAAVNVLLEQVRARIAAVRVHTTSRVEELEQRAAEGEDRLVSELRERVEGLRELVVQAETQVKSMSTRFRGSPIEEE